jgi:hypothetical protein
MANIVSVREFTKLYREMKPGQQVVIVDACRLKILACLECKEKPESIERNIKQIFTS